MVGTAPTKLGFSHTLALVFQTVLHRWRTCLSIAAIYAILVGATDAVSRTSTGIVDPTTVSASQVLAAGVAALGALFVLVLVNVFVLPLTIGSLALVGSAGVYEDVVDTKRVLRRAFDRGLELVATFIVTALILGAGPIIVGLVALVLVVLAPDVGFAILIFGFFLLLVPVLYVLVRLSLAFAVVMREQRGALGSLRRSWQLVGGHWWSVFGVVVVLGLCIALLNTALSYLSFIGQDTAADFVGGFILSAFAAALWTILYGVAAGVVYARLTPEDITVDVVAAPPHEDVTEDAPTPEVAPVPEPRPPAVAPTPIPAAPEQSPPPPPRPDPPPSPPAQPPEPSPLVQPPAPPPVQDDESPVPEHLWPPGAPPASPSQ